MRTAGGWGDCGWGDSMFPDRYGHTDTEETGE